jgi:hypothetical protein
MSPEELRRVKLVSDGTGLANHFSLLAQELWADDMGITIEELLSSKK